MNTPDIKFYAELVETTAEGKQTPKYTITKAVGYYPAMAQLVGRDGRISFYMTQKQKDGLEIPSYSLQGKGSLNFTGLKDLFAEGKLTGFAYGYPFKEKTYGKKKPRQNPFYEDRMDGYLFKMYQGDLDNTKPTKIELLVLSGAKPLIASWCKMLQQGGFDEALSTLRKQANPI